MTQRTHSRSCGRIFELDIEIYMTNWVVLSDLDEIKKMEEIRAVPNSRFYYLAE